MKVEYESGKSGGIIRVFGELDHCGSLEAMCKLNKILDENCPGVLTLDMGGVSFMDSSGIAFIMRAKRRQFFIGGELKIINLSRQAARVLSSAGILSAPRSS